MAKRKAFGMLPIAFGFGLGAAAKPLELQGDLAIAAGDRLLFHGLALLFTLAALACFLRGAWVIGRTIFGGAKSPTTELAKVFSDEGSFDADAALAHYMEAKRDTASSTSTPTRPAGGSFGRKGT